jgi:hypothetical protein
MTKQKSADDTPDEELHRRLANAVLLGLPAMKFWQDLELEIDYIKEEIDNGEIVEFVDCRYLIVQNVRHRGAIITALYDGADTLEETQDVVEGFLFGIEPPKNCIHEAEVYDLNLGRRIVFDIIKEISFRLGDST